MPLPLAVAAWTSNPLEAVGLGVGVGAGDGVAVGAGVGDGVGDAVGTGEADADELGVGETDADGLDAGRVEDGDADALGRTAGWVAGAGGSVAVLMPTGPRSAQAPPSRAEPQASAVCSAVTVPREDGDAAELAARVR